jgi:predicted transcriptional regulator
MWDRLLQMLPVGCRHSHMSLPFSVMPPPKKSSHEEQWDRVPPSKRAIYVVCLDCGRHFDYDWSHMRVMK